MPRPRKTDPTKAPRLDQAALGQYGVNVVDSPLHCADGELRLAQNVERSRDEGIGGLRKRKGIGLFTADNLGGPVLSIIPVPLPNPIIETSAETFWWDGVSMVPVSAEGAETIWHDGFVFNGGGEP